MGLQDIELLQIEACLCRIEYLPSHGSVAVGVACVETGRWSSVTVVCGPVSNSLEDEGVVVVKAVGHIILYASGLRFVPSELHTMALLASCEVLGWRQHRTVYNEAYSGA